MSTHNICLFLWRNKKNYLRIITKYALLSPARMLIRLYAFLHILQSDLVIKYVKICNNSQTEDQTHFYIFLIFFSIKHMLWIFIRITPDRRF